MFKVFVYGSLRKELGNDINLMAERAGSEIEYLGMDTIEAEMYSLVWYPAIVFSGVSGKSVQVLGEVYEVKTNQEDMLKRLDALEGYPDYYNRKLIDTEFGKAWVYFHESPPREGILMATGDWKDYLDFYEGKYYDEGKHYGYRRKYYGYRNQRSRADKI